jgi:hypothetical protein
LQGFFYFTIIYCDTQTYDQSGKDCIQDQAQESRAAVLTQRINTAQAAMDRAQEAANSEEKSSSGDKYETGRAMGQRWGAGCH